MRDARRGAHAPRRRRGARRRWCCTAPATEPSDLAGGHQQGAEEEGVAGARRAPRLASSPSRGAAPRAAAPSGLARAGALAGSSTRSARRPPPPAPARAAPAGAQQHRLHQPLARQPHGRLQRPLLQALREDDAPRALRAPASGPASTELSGVRLREARRRRRAQHRGRHEPRYVATERGDLAHQGSREEGVVGVGGEEERLDTGHTAPGSSAPSGTRTRSRTTARSPRMTSARAALAGEVHEQPLRTRPPPRAARRRRPRGSSPCAPPRRRGRAWPGVARWATATIDAVREAQAAADDVLVPQGDGVEGAGADGGARGVAHASGAGRKVSRVSP